MENKKLLEKLSIEQLEAIKAIIQTTPVDMTVKMIDEINQERIKRKQTNWNSQYSVNDLVLDYRLVQLLKANKIYTLQDLMDANVANIQGITTQDLEDIEWAKIFFDMTPLQKVGQKSDLEVAEIIVKQSNEANQYLKNKR